MSLKTWKEAFYPISASECGKADAIAHSLRKWEGLREEHLAEHGLKRGLHALYEIEGSKEELLIDFASCALCTHYIDACFCNTCPLAIVRGGVPCDSCREDEDCSPYAKNSPELMIMWLKKALGVSLVG